MEQRIVATHIGEEKRKNDARQLEAAQQLTEMQREIVQIQREMAANDATRTTRERWTFWLVALTFVVSAISAILSLLAYLGQK